MAPNDTNGQIDVFIRDRQLGTTQRVSVAHDGTQDSHASDQPAISGDGRFVEFRAEGDQLSPSHGNGDALLWDRMTGNLESVAIDSTGTFRPGSTVQMRPFAINVDGRFVALTTTQPLVPSDRNNTEDVYLRDRQNGTTTRLSVGIGGTDTNDASFSPSMTPDGRYVAFYSVASNLVPGDTNGRPDVFVRDTLANTTIRVSVDVMGRQVEGDSIRPSISADGRFVAFSTDAQIVPQDADAFFDIYVKDLLTGSVERVSVTSTGGAANNHSGFAPSISADGRFVTFVSQASNFVPPDEDSNADIDVFVHDRMTGTTTRMSVNARGWGASTYGGSAVISRDGSTVVYAGFGGLVEGQRTADVLAIPRFSCP